MPQPGGIERGVRYEESPNKELKEGQLVGVFCKIQSLRPLRENLIYVTLPTLRGDLDSSEGNWINYNETLFVPRRKLSVLGQKFPEEERLEGVLEVQIARLPLNEDKNWVAIEDPRGNIQHVRKENLFIPEVE